MLPRPQFLENFSSSCDTFTRLLSRNFCNDRTRRLSSVNQQLALVTMPISQTNNVTFQNSDQSSCTNLSHTRHQQHQHQQSQHAPAPGPQPRKRADTFHGTASLTVAAALNNINLSSLGTFSTSSNPTKESSSSSNRVSRAPSPSAAGASDNRSKFYTHKIEILPYTNQKTENRIRQTTEKVFNLVSVSDFSSFFRFRFFES